MADKSKKWRSSSGGGDMFYCLGIIGALVYFFQQASGFWPSVVAVLKSLVWPAFAVYELLKFLQV